MKKLIYVLVIIVTLFTSCNNVSEKANRALLQAEEAMTLSPDSALSILKSIEYPQRLREKDQADYALLLTQAMDKKYMKFESDSLISLAVDYYNEQPDLLNRAKSYFYMGRVKSELKESEEAMQYFLKAKKIFEHTEEYKFLGMIHEEMGMLNRIAKLYDKAIVNHKAAISYHELNKDTTSLIFVYENLAFTYLLVPDVPNAEIHYEEALRLLDGNYEHRKYPLVLRGLGIVHRDKGDHVKAEKYFSAAEKFYSEEKLPLFHLSTAKLLLIIEEMDGAESYFQKSLNATSIDTQMEAFYFLYTIEKEKKNFSDAIVYKEKSDSLYYSGQYEKMQAELTEIQAKYEYELLEETKQRQLEHLVALIAVVIALLLYAIKKIIQHRRELTNQRLIIRKLEEKRDEYEKQIQQIDADREMDVTDSNKSVLFLRSKVTELTVEVDRRKENMYVDGFKTFFYLKEGRSNNIKTSPEAWEEVHEMMNVMHRNFCARLKEAYPSLTKHDLHLACMIRVGLSNKELVKVFACEENSIFKAKTRLRDRLKLPKDMKLDDFIWFF